MVEDNACVAPRRHAPGCGNRAATALGSSVAMSGGQLTTLTRIWSSQRPAGLLRLDFLSYVTLWAMCDK